MTVCSIDGCEKPARKRGWCEMHYWRYRQHGDPLIVHSAGRPRGSIDHGHTAGGTLTPTYLSYRAMINRCTYPSCNSWERYGGGGIQVADRWRGLGGFSNFLADLGERPEGATLDRINPDGHYEPSNCRWAAEDVQSRNKRRMPADREERLRHHREAQARYSSKKARRQ